MKKGNQETWIEKLGLLPHPEGGYFRETYRGTIQSNYKGFHQNRNISTAIYFMLTKGNFSAFHKIKSDEMWHFYDGDPISVFLFNSNGQLQELKLGLNLDNGELPQAVVPADCWFASRLMDYGEFALVGCTVAPGFDFADFELAKRADLLGLYPNNEKIITELTRS